MKIKADRDVCIAAGQCYLAAPAVFDLDDEDGTVVVLQADPTGADVEAARQAVATCPSGAISLVE